MTEITSPSSHGYCFASVPSRIAFYFQIWAKKYSEAQMNFPLNPILSYIHKTGHRAFWALLIIFSILQSIWTSDLTQYPKTVILAHFRSYHSDPILASIQSSPGWRVRTVSSGKQHFFWSTVCTSPHSGDAKMNPSAWQADLIAFMKKKWERSKTAKLGPSSLCHKDHQVPRTFTCIKHVPTFSLARGDSDQSVSGYLHILSERSAFSPEMW